MPGHPRRGDAGEPPAIFLMGPTASGKTAVALALQERFPVDIVSVDSAQVYRGMDIGTAKPDAGTLRRAPHRLIDIRDPSQSYSAAEFREDALREMAQIAAAGRVPLLVGGTMLYFRTLVRGIAALPAADPAVRARIEAEAERSGWLALHSRLAGIDPASAARIHPNDPQRIQRALEVFELTGRPLGELQREQREKADAGFGYRVLRLVVSPRSRQELHRRIAARFDSMLERGFLDEVRGLRARGDLDADLPALRSVGYRQAWRFVSGEIGLEEARRTAVAATRQLAKRQLTWLRQEPEALWYDAGSDVALRSVFQEVGTFLGMPPA